MDPRETNENDTEKPMNLLAETKHLTNRRNHITWTVENHGTEKDFFVDTGSPTAILPRDKEKKAKITLKKKRKNQDVNKNEDKIFRTITVEADSRTLKKFYQCSLPSEMT